MDLGGIALFKKLDKKEHKSFYVPSSSADRAWIDVLHVWLRYQDATDEVCFPACRAIKQSFDDHIHAGFHDPDHKSFKAVPEQRGATAESASAITDGGVPAEPAHISTTADGAFATTAEGVFAATAEGTFAATAKAASARSAHATAADGASAATAEGALAAIAEGVLAATAEGTSARSAFAATAECAFAATVDSGQSPFQWQPQLCGGPPPMGPRMAARAKEEAARVLARVSAMA